MRAALTALLFVSALAFAPALTSASDARAAEPAPKLIDMQRAHVGLGRAGILALPGELDLYFQHVDAIPVARVDDRDAELPSNEAAFVRLRLSPSLTLVDPDKGSFFNVWRLQTELDLLHDWWVVGEGRDVVAADPRGRSDTGLVGQRLSELFIGATGQWLAWQAGLVRSRWGLGLVANGGDDPMMQTSDSPFGVAYQGDHVVRLGVAAYPLGKGLARPPFTASLAFDGVVDDDTASWSDGDRAYQLVVALQGRTDNFSLGFYAAQREQSNHEGGTTEATVLDVTGRVELAQEAALNVFLEAEIATIRGRTSLPQSVVSDDSFDIDQLGAVARFGIESGVFLGVLEVGAASGDENAFDDEQRGFAMDRDHRVGLLLFREALMAGAAVTVENIADDDYRGTSPRGSDKLATEGAVRGAIYANPRVSFAVTDKLHVYGGFLYAASDGQYNDAFWSGIAGGAPRGPRNGAPATDLGWEVDLGVSWRIQSESLAWRLRLEGAWDQPGAVFDDEAGKAAPGIAGAWLQAGMVW